MCVGIYPYKVGGGKKYNSRIATVYVMHTQLLFEMIENGKWIRCLFDMPVHPAKCLK